MNRVRSVRILALALLLVLAGCTDPPAEPAASDHNQADLLFTHRMIEHNKQAIDAAGLATDRTANATVRELAAGIVADANNQLLTEWANKWGAAPAGAAASIPGAIKAEDLARLRGLAGGGFTSQWLDRMIVHHRGAITMAQTELAQGQNTDAKALAQRIVDSSESRLARMQGMTGG